MRSTLSILGLYEYNPSVFDELQLPDGVSRDVVINNILFESAELEVLYPNHATMREAIGWWSRKQLPEWEKMWRALQITYNPIENYFRDDYYNEHNKKNDDFSTIQEETGTLTGNASSTSKTEDVGQVSAYNGEGFANRDHSTTENGTESDSAANQHATQEAATTRTVEENNSTDSHRRGKIGVTSQQRLLEQELNLAEKTLYKKIVDEFQRRFCLLIY